MSYQSQIPIPPQERERLREEEEQRRRAEEELNAFTGKRYEAPLAQEQARPQEQQFRASFTVNTTPQTAPSVSEERNWAMLCHLASLSGGMIPSGAIVGPLVVWLLGKDRMPLVDDQGKEVLNFQITAHLLMLLSVPLTFLFGLGFFLFFAVAIADLVCTILGAVAAYNGQRYRYPLTIRFIK
jgi:uncharacterized Tic20 family protein